MTSRRVKYVPAVGPRLKKLLAVVFALFALLVVDSVYLVSVTVAGVEYQGWFYLIMFMVHLVLGLALVVPVVLFGALHIRNARNRPNKRAIRAGYALFTTALVVLATGLVLTRVDLFGVRLEVNNALARGVAYWLHVIGPLVAIWLFVLHRLAGRRIKWKVGVAWSGVAGVFALVMLLLQAQDPRQWNVAGPQTGDQYFRPSLARTSTGNFIPARVLQNDQYCLECHPDIHHSWMHSAHKLSSFNNPAYLFSVLETRRVVMERDGSVQASRFCAGCHDPVPFFSGAFDDKKFDDPDYDLAADPMAQAGITCTACHAISHINSVRGNADYTIDEPIHYPFAFSESPFLRWVNRQLVKAKPEFHKATFLKPLHTSTEFCGSCHKVHLPKELNGYKFLRGQNHYDSFWLSGTSGQGVASFYYPPKAEENCNGCHMPAVPSDDFAARMIDGQMAVHDHMFPSANTALPHLVDVPDPEAAIEAHHAFLQDALRVDIFGLRAEGRIDGELTAPLRPQLPVLARGETYLLETVVRTTGMGHLFTEGTSDSNEVWIDVTVRHGDRVIGRSGGRRDDGQVDPWSHFINSFVLDREGNRIDRRNAQDIFVPLYNHQIPPGAADVVHYAFRVPDDVNEAITFDVKVKFRKFDTTYMRIFQGDDFDGNDLPIVTLAEDQVTLPVKGDADASGTVSLIPEWERWNDYGIGLLRKGERGELRGAEEAFRQVETLGRADGPLNLARVYLKEGRVATDAPEALRRAADEGRFDEPAPPWSVLWFTGQVNKQNAMLDEAIADFERIVDGGLAGAAERGFDFSKDYRLLNELGETLFLRAQMERGPGRQATRRQFLERARDRYRQTLGYDPENVTAHHGLMQVLRDLDDTAGAEEHARLHQLYKPDDNARDRAIALARQKYPAANKAAEAVVIYDLQRSGAYELEP